MPENRWAGIPPLPAVRSTGMPKSPERRGMRMAEVPRPIQERYW